MSEAAAADVDRVLFLRIGQKQTAHSRVVVVVVSN